MALWGAVQNYPACPVASGFADVTDCSIDKTPMRVTPHILATDLEDNTILFQCIIGTQLISYATIIGSLMYTTLGTHPDLAHIVGILG